MIDPDILLTQLNEEYRRLQNVEQGFIAQKEVSQELRAMNNILWRQLKSLETLIKED